MLIDSGWLHAFKEKVPEAFTARAPFRPRAVFVEGWVYLCCLLAVALEGRGRTDARKKAQIRGTA